MYTYLYISILNYDRVEQKYASLNTKSTNQLSNIKSKQMQNTKT